MDLYPFPLHVMVVGAAVAVVGAVAVAVAIRVAAVRVAAVRVAAVRVAVAVAVAVANLREKTKRNVIPARLTVFFKCRKRYEIRSKIKHNQTSNRHFSQKSPS
ncbi:hypothetical protein ACMFMF_007714 [Clarireedia jacksonii]